MTPCKRALLTSGALRPSDPVSAPVCPNFPIGLVRPQQPLIYYCDTLVIRLRYDCNYLIFNMLQASTMYHVSQTTRPKTV
nr:MAG TPA: hypothetical protein [Caudoviricetes sp.]